MSRIVLPTITEWNDVNLADGLCMIEGGLAELLQPGLWEGCTLAWFHGLDQHPWDLSNGRAIGTRNNGVADVADGWSFDGTNDYLSASYSQSASPLTISVGAKKDSSIGSSDHVLDWDAGGTPRIILRVASNDWFIRDSSGNIIPSSGPNLAAGIISNESHIYVCTINGTTATSYRDGVQIDQETNGSYSAPTLTGITVGDAFGQTGSNPFGGFVNALRIYNRILTLNELGLLGEQDSTPYECRLLPRVFTVPVAAAVGTRNPLVMGSTNLLRGKI